MPAVLLSNRKSAVKNNYDSSNQDDWVMERKLQTTRFVKRTYIARKYFNDACVYFISSFTVLNTFFGQ